jgi:hypothetical protein
MSTLCFVEIENCLTLSSMLGDSSCSISPLSWPGRVLHIANARRRIGCLERGAIGLNTFRAKEGICPMRTVDVGAVCDWCLGECAVCYYR